MSQSAFIVALVTTQSILAYTKGLSVKLQGPYVDVARAHREIKTVKAALQGIRSNVTTFHARVYAQASQMAQSVDVELSTPRLASRQHHRQNIPAQNSQDYFHLNLTIPLLDHLLSELNSRFDAASSQKILEFMRLLPSAILLQGEINGTLRTLLSSMRMIFHLWYPLNLRLTCGSTSGQLSHSLLPDLTPLRKP